jgi:hypothetical protein
VNGFTPDDTVIGFAGLVWMGQLLGTLEARGLYLVLIAIGVGWVLVRNLETPEGLLWRLGVYVVTALVLLEVFGGHGVSIARTRSFAEANGATVTPGAGQGPLTDAVVPRGFLVATGALQQTVEALLPRINADFVRNPFALFAAANSLLTANLDDDPPLRARVGEFLDRCYRPALTRWLEVNPIPTREEMADIDTPLSAGLAPLYARLAYPPADGSGPTTCGAVWDPLRADLTRYAEQHGVSAFMDVLGTRLSLAGIGTDTWLRSALRIMRRGLSVAEPFNQQGVVDPIGQRVLGAFAFLTNWARLAQLVELVRFAAFPLMGYLTATLYVGFPIVLAASLLPSGAGRLVTYFALLGSVKAWPLVWAMVDRVYGSILPSLWPLLDRGTASLSELGSGRQAEALNLVAGLMYLVGPMMLTTAMGIVGQQLGQGLTMFSTARPALGKARLG